MTIKDVLDVYNQQKSVRRTAYILGISQTVVRKVLVTYRITDTPIVHRIAELRATGMPARDIANMLHISRSTVNVYTPYSKGTYLNPSKTSNAKRLRKFHEKQKDALDNSIEL